MFRRSLNLFALFVLIFGVFSCSSNSANLEPISTAEPTSTVEPTPTSEIGPPPTLTSGPNWCQAFPWDQLNGRTQEDASNRIEGMGFDYGLYLSIINWADAYNNEVPEGTVIAANANDCENIIVVISLGPHPTQTSQSEEIPDCGEDQYQGWTGECCPTDGSNSNCGVSPCHKIGGSPDYEYDENGECVKKEPLPDHQERSGFQDINACKLTIQSQEALSLAYDRPTDRLNPTGLVETVVLFADFADVSATQSTEEVFSYISPGAEDFFFDQSYGRLTLSFVPHHKWLRLSGTAAIYREALTSYTGHRDWIQEAMNLADDNVDFSDADAVLVVSPPNAMEVPYGPTLMGWSTPNDGSLTADGTYIANAVTSGADLTYWGDLWYPHEMGHSLGLPDLYGATIPDRAGFTRPFSLMDDIGSTAPGYMGYSRWILRWLDDSQVACIEGNATVTLTPLATFGGLKVALFPFSQSRALAIESRRQIGYDNDLAREGAVVYIVNTENGFGGGSGEGPMEVLNDAQALLPGESLTYENVTVTFEETTTEADIIQIQINE